jgi:hypothetical protein
MILQERLAGPEIAGVDVLIQEARRRRRRRWLTGLAATVVVVGASGLGYNLAADGSPPAKLISHSLGNALPAAPSPLARWTDLSNDGGLPADAEITSVVRFDGRLFAAGSYFGGGTALSGVSCSVGGCNPMAWTSNDGSGWSVVLAQKPTGSIAGERLVVTSMGLFMFNTAESSTSLWKSTNGTSWRRVAIPAGMAGLDLSGVSWGHGRLVAILSNKFAGTRDTAYGDADTIWTSTNGTSWKQDAVPDTPKFTALTITSSGFLASGTSRATSHPTLWQSSNGITWMASAIAIPEGNPFIAADGKNLVVEDSIPASTADKAEIQIWQSTDGKTWTRAAIKDGPVAPQDLASVGMSPILTTPRGFIVSGKLPAQLWSSSSGGSWTPVVEEHLPPKADHVEEIFSDGSGLLAVATSTRTSASALTTSVWQVTFGVTTR